MSREVAGSPPGAPAGDDPRVGDFDLGEVPTAREIRRFTARAARARAGAGVGALLTDVYTAVTSVAISVLIVLGVVQQLGASLPPAPPTHAPGGLSLPVLVVLLLLAGAGALLSTAGRLGPVGAEGPQASWWLPLPVDRRGLLRPAAARVPAVAALAGAVVVVVLDAGLLARGGAELVRAGLLGALLSAGVVLGAAVAQARVPRRRLALAGDAVLLAAPVLAALVVLSGRTPATLPSPSWLVVLLTALVAAALAVVVDRRLEHLPGRTLREGGSVATQAVGAVVSLDSRELGRALTGGAAPSVRRRVARLRTARGPATALVTADLVVLRRSLRHVVQVVVAVGLPVLATLVPQLASPAGVLVAVLVGGWMASSASAEGARWAEMAPVLDRLLPLDDRTVRRLRMVAPGLVALVWSLLTFTAVGRWQGATSDWLVLAVAAAPVWAAAAVRAAYRPAPRWDKPLVATPAGALPMGVLQVVARGPDLVAFCLLPLWVALGLGTVTTFMVTAQVALSTIAFAVASSTAEKGWMERLLEDQDAQRRGGAA
ncbi:conserved hypothetical protein [Cellulomonas flavigena DSM 20109]|uniref:Uncharacterized protein n=1 Tax=Cellulomonas flavigena (strain ATCC 482 / DSM 20109 / BCRC 11376 / JCM 18109 / NBRC 3775 / NCIMB 8073 / NRS 134) TaxID=446466 RepID=D5UGU4_CELFN|nr:DUF6297 family protein [Cellulomonas flavigena]ADG75192.1 conserved hypothetical protein [Cellulomonas flavigena DSM 20109]